MGSGGFVIAVEFEESREEGQDKRKGDLLVAYSVSMVISVRGSLASPRKLRRAVMQLCSLRGSCIVHTLKRGSYQIEEQGKGNDPQDLFPRRGVYGSYHDGWTRWLEDVGAREGRKSRQRNNHRREKREIRVFGREG